jgi:teichuronic acid biosynthesis glycosyltransferase TuaG
MSPLVAVIITTYNSSNTIEACLSSLLNQTHKNIEVLIYDDCSKDNTCTVAKEALKDQGIHYIVKTGDENFGGPAKGRNWGCANAKGDYICFLDADDTWEKNKVEVQLNVMQTKKITVCSTNATVINGPQFPMISGYISVNKMMRRNRLILSSVMIKKSIINNLPYVFNEDKGYISVEDYDLLLRLSLLNNEIFVIPERLTKYLVLENSISHIDMRENELKRLHVLEKLKVNNVFQYLWKSLVILSYKIKYK